MKIFTCKKLLKGISFIAINIAFIVNADSQTWCSAGATWYYSNVYPGVNGYVKLTYTIDTVINSKNCKKITYYGEGFTYSIPSGIYSTFGSPFYTYEQNGVAYLYNDRFGNNKFDTLFNINAQIGDKWRFPLVDTACADSLFFINVLNTGTRTLNGFNLKWLYVKKGPFGYTANGILNYSLDTITERLGYRYDYIDYSPCYGNNETGDYNGNFRCYSDDTFGLYSTGISSSCDYFKDETSFGELQIEQGILKIYPNPAQSQITIEFNTTEKSFFSVQIKNILGKTVKVIDDRAFSNGKNKIKIDVSEFSKGLYFVQLQSENEIKSTKFAKH